MAHMRQPRPDSGPGLQIKVLGTFEGALSSLGSGRGVSLRVLRVSRDGWSVEYWVVSVKREGVGCRVQGVGFGG